MKNLFFTLFVSISLLSCGQDKKPPKEYAFLFFKLGSTSDELLKELRSLESTGGLKKVGSDYYWTSEVEDQPYYYSPIFTFAPSDSVCSEMKLMFFDQLESMQNDLYATKRNEVAMNLMYWAIGRVKSWKLRDHIVKDIISERGQYNSRDTVKFSDSQVELTKWSGNNGVEITVRFRFLRDQITTTSFAGNSSLTVTYSFSEDIMKKYFKPTRQF